MAITTAQFNAGCRAILQNLFTTRTDAQIPIIRVICKLHRDAPNATQREVLKAIWNEAYQFRHGVSPVGSHHALQVQREACEDVTGIDPIIVDRTACFDAEAVTVN